MGYTVRQLKSALQHVPEDREIYIDTNDGMRALESAHTERFDYHGPQITLLSDKEGK